MRYDDGAARMSLFWPHDPAAEIVVEAPATRSLPDPSVLLIGAEPGFVAQLVQRFPSTIMNDAAPESSITNNPARLRRYDVFTVEGLYMRLAERAPDETGALDFAQKYGLLHAEGSEPAGAIVHEIETMRQVVALKVSGDWPALDAFMRANKRALALAPIFRDAPGEARPILFFQPADLLCAIYVQLLQDATGNATLRRCARPGCDEWFKFGPGTKHRDTALYHSQKCQKAHAYMKLKGE